MRGEEAEGEGWGLGVMDLFSSLSGGSPVPVEQNKNHSIGRVLRGLCQLGSISVLPKLGKGEALRNQNYVLQLIY